MNDDEKEAALRKRGSDLFDEMSVAGLEMIDEEIRQTLREMFSNGFVNGWAQGHFAGMSEVVAMMRRPSA